MLFLISLQDDQSKYKFAGVLHSDEIGDVEIGSQT
jgi:hypothetical protein